METARNTLKDIRTGGIFTAGRQLGKSTMMKVWMDEYMSECVPRKCIFIPISAYRGIVLDVDDLDVLDDARIVDGDPTRGKLRFSADPVDIRIIDRDRIGETPADPAVLKAARDQHRAKLMEELAALDREDSKV